MRENMGELLLDLALGWALFLLYLGLFLIASLIAYVAMLSGNTAVMVLFGAAGCCRVIYLLVSGRMQIDEVPATPFIDVHTQGVMANGTTNMVNPTNQQNHLPC